MLLAQEVEICSDEDPDSCVQVDLYESSQDPSVFNENVDKIANFYDLTDETFDNQIDLPYSFMSSALHPSYVNEYNNFLDYSSGQISYANFGVSLFNPTAMISSICQAGSYATIAIFVLSLTMQIHIPHYTTFAISLIATCFGVLPVIKMLTR